MDRDEQDPSCVCLNLLWLDSAIARLPRQREPVVRHTCRREVHCGRVREVLEELQAIFGESFDDFNQRHMDQIWLWGHPAKDLKMS